MTEYKNYALALIDDPTVSESSLKNQFLEWSGPDGKVNEEEYKTMTLLTGLPWQNWPKAKIDIFIPTFWSPILNILDLQQSGMMKIIKTVQALF